METSDYVICILGRAIHQIQRETSSSANVDLLLTTMKAFSDVIRLRAEHHKIGKKKDGKSEVKSLTARQQKVSMRQKLRKMWADFRAEMKFVDEIVVQNCALIIQQQQSHQKLIAKKKAVAEYKMAMDKKELQRKREEIYEIMLSELNKRLEEARMTNMFREKEQRNYWSNKKEELNDIQMKYDAKILVLQKELEGVLEILNREAEELHFFEQAYATQEIPYDELMKEKAEYLEQLRQQKLYEIRLRIAKRTIVKFIEEHYPAWKKKKLKASKKKGKYKFNLNKK